MLSRNCIREALKLDLDTASRLMRRSQLPYLAREGTHEDPARSQQLIGLFLLMPVKNVHEI
jgi:hypothetical protein